MGATPDVSNNIARTHLLSLLQLTNSQGLALTNLAITLSAEVQGIRVSSQLVTLPGCVYETIYLLVNF
jgi:hypothetical protein